MAIQVRCECGKNLRASDEAAGRRARCPACQRIHTLPSLPPPPPVEETPPAYESDPAYEPGSAYGASDDDFGEYGVAPAAVPPAPEPVIARPAARPRPAAAAVAPARSSSPGPISLAAPSARKFWYALFLLALLPLAWSTFQPEARPAGLEEYLARTIDHHPELKEKVVTWLKSAVAGQQSSEEEIKAGLFNLLPDHRFDGALLAYDSWAHWVMAAASAAAFFALVMLVFPRGHAKPAHLLLIGLFTGTAGILLLLGVQWVAFRTEGMVVHGRGIVVLLFYLVQFIGWSYHSAMAAGSNFFLSAFGFTFGVGFCEEMCKSLPLVWLARRGRMVSWRGACMWGLMSGVGFGVSEGITYSTGHYNGILGADIYLIRFASCVALHAIWAASVGIVLYKRQATFQGSMAILEWLARILAVIIVPMVLHGMYDTLLKEDHNVWALAVAFVSFGWLAYQIESTRVKEDRQIAGYAAGAAA